MEGAGTSRRTSIRKKFSQFKLVSLERSDFEEQQENSGKQDEEEDGILENDSPSDDDDIPSRKRFPLRKKYSLQQQNFVQLIFLYLRCYGTLGLP